MIVRWLPLTGRVSRRTPVRSFVGVLSAVALSMLVLSASASALLTYPSDGQLAPSVSFRSVEPGDIAVNDFNGDTYVAEANTGVVHIVDAGGTEVGSLNGSMTPAGSFGGGRSGPFGVYSISVSANNGTGDVYVADPVHNVVDEFNFAGEYECQITGNSTPSATECNGPAGSATPAGGFNAPEGVTVDQATGRVYVVDANNHAVDIFSLKGAYQSQISLPSGASGIFPELTRGVAVDDFNGNVYVSGFANSIPGRGAEVPVIFEFNSGGIYVTTLTGSNTPGGQFSGRPSVAVDNANGDFFIAAGDYPPAAGGVYVFDAAGNYLTRIGEDSVNGIPVEVDQASGKIYVSLRENIEIFGPGVLIPDVTTGAATEIKRQSVALSGTVDPDDAGPATCEFVWGTSTTFDKSTPCSETVPNGNLPVAVHVTLSGLQPNTTYHYRLQAGNANGMNAGEESQDQAFTTSGPAGIDEEPVWDVTASAATLNATITTHNAATNYYFQYGASTAYGTDAPSAPGQSLGSDEHTIEVSQHVQLPLVGTLYHFRVVTVTQIELAPGVYETTETDGPDMTLTTQAIPDGGSVLADSRQWEQVSSVDKRGAQIYGIDQYANEGAVIQASASGNAISYVTDSPTEVSPAGYTNLLQVFSARGSDGWVSHDISPEHNGSTGVAIGNGQEYRIFSEDLSLGAINPFGKFIASLSPEASEPTAYLRTVYGPGGPVDSCSLSCYRPLVTGASGFANVPEGTVFGEEVEGRCRSAESGLLCGPHAVGGTPDLSRVLLKSPVALTSASASTGGLYEWSAGKLALVSVLPGPSGEAADGPRFGTERVTGGNESHAISDDGSRIFFTSGGSTFMRDLPRKETVLLSKEGEFEDASTDGSKVFFDNEMCEVRIDEATGELECPVAFGDGKVVGASDDGSWLYFVSEATLASGGVSGENNLYVRHDGVTRFIAAISNEDAAQITGNNNPLISTARVSHNGHWLAFMSQLDLTGYSTRDALTGQSDAEVYLYDAEANDGAGGLVCASCNPTGARPVAATQTRESLWSAGVIVPRAAASIPGWTPYTGNNALYESRALSDDGRLFFNGGDSLIPQDVNGTWDVYEYEPESIGSCNSSSSRFSERSDGCVSLVSSGESSEESGFLDASQAGGDVFFLTSAKLASSDEDASLDIYDAHECSPSVPCFAVPSSRPPACDTGDSCKTAPSPQPEAFGAPASATFAGAGNVVSSRATGPVAATKGLTQAQKLARALKVCHTQKRAKRRAACIKRARARYATRKATARGRSGR